MDDFEFIGKYLSFLYRYGQAFLDRELKPYQISSGQFFILMPLFKQDGINQEAISQINKVDKATITRGIQKLIDEGYVTRKRDKQDKRAYRVYLTKKGKSIKSGILSIAQQWDDILLAHLDKEQREMIKGVLDTMIENASQTRNES